MPLSTYQSLHHKVRPCYVLHTVMFDSGTGQRQMNLEYISFPEAKMLCKAVMMLCSSVLCRPVQHYGCIVLFMLFQDAKKHAVIQVNFLAQSLPVCATVRSIICVVHK